MNTQNLFAALRAAFPSNLDAIAVETDEGLNYSWRDLDRATAMMANLLESLELPEGSRIAVQVEKSVEAMMLYLATLRAGYVFLPLNTAYQSAEIEYFIGNAEPAVVVCSPANFGWVSKIAFKAGTKHVFTLGDDRTGSLLERAAHHSDQHQAAVKQADDLAAIMWHATRAPSGSNRQPVRYVVLRDGPTAQQAKPGATTTAMTSRPQPPAHQQPGLPKIAATPGFVDPSTLLPRRGPQGAAVRAASAASDRRSSTPSAARSSPRGSTSPTRASGLRTAAWPTSPPAA